MVKPAVLFVNLSILLFAALPTGLFFLDSLQQIHPLPLLFQFSSVFTTLLSTGLCVCTLYCKHDSMHFLWHSGRALLDPCTHSQATHNGDGAGWHSGWQQHRTTARWKSMTVPSPTVPTATSWHRQGNIATRAWTAPHQ